MTLRANSFGCGDKAFAGWALSEGGPAVYADGKTLTDMAAIQDNVIHLYAVWVGTRYTVRFDSHGGVGRMENQTFVIGVAQNLTQCSFVRDGYKFAGWALSTTSAAIYRDKERVEDLLTSRDAAVVLYAVWIVPGRGGDGWTACDVSFDAQGGIIDMDFRTITSGAELETLPQPSKAGCEFDGWFTSPDGGSRIAENTVVTMSARYYARWKSNGITPVPEPEPVPVEPDPVPAPEPEPTPEPQPGPQPEPTPEPEPTPVPTPDPKPTPEPAPERAINEDWPESTIVPVEVKDEGEVDEAIEVKKAKTLAGALVDKDEMAVGAAQAGKI